MEGPRDREMVGKSTEKKIEKHTLTGKQLFMGDAENPMPKPPVPIHE
jgi:hypothetical protein